jgi:hypothetical protein
LNALVPHRAIAATANRGEAWKVAVLLDDPRMSVSHAIFQRG